MYIIDRAVKKQNSIEWLEKTNAQDVADQRHSFDCSDAELQRKMQEYAATLELKKNDIRRVREGEQSTIESSLQHQEGERRRTLYYRLFITTSGGLENENFVL